MRILLAAWIPAMLLGQGPAEPRFRVSVGLVQVDAVVTDSHGQPVASLQKDDFRILLDGKPQPIRECTYVAVEGGAPGGSSSKALNQASAAGGIQFPLKREGVRRTIVLFVDNFTLSAESAPGVRNGIRKFLEMRTEPGDLLAIVRASAGLGALQDFTTDRNRLLAAADQVRWIPGGRGGVGAYTLLGQNSADDKMLAEQPRAKHMRREEEISRVSEYTLAVTSALQRLLRNMADLPGRKSIVVLSDSLPLATPDELEVDGSTAVGSGVFGGPILQSMRKVVDESVRAGVVLYTVDTRGLNTLRAQAADRPVPTQKVTPDQPGPDGQRVPTQTVETSAAMGNGDWVWEALQVRRDEYSQGQWGSLFLANETGGFMVTESNRIDVALGRIMNDQRGYYLLAFTPPAEALELGRDGRPIYRKIRVEVLRPGLTARAHKGFYGVPDEERPLPEAELRLATALESPFQAAGVGVDVRTSYLMAKKNLPFVQTAVWIAGRDLRLTGPANHKTGVIHLIVRAFSVAGTVLEGGIDQMLRVDLDADGYRRALDYGLVYSAILEVPKPGPYQVRAACRDERTGRTGTGGDFLEIPKATGRKLGLSGIVFTSLLGDDGKVVPAKASPNFAPGETVRFTYQIYNPGASLMVRTQLLRDGRVVAETPSAPLAERDRVGASTYTRGELRLPPNLESGEYMLRVELTDGRQTAAEWARVTVASDGPVPDAAAAP